MRGGRTVLVFSGIVFLLMAPSLAAGPFVLFPKANQLRSPDGRFVVSTSERKESSAEFAGTFDSLWLTDVATGRSHKLCDYFGVAAVAWSGNDFLLVTQYVGRKAARALIVSVGKPESSIMLDSAALSRALPLALQAKLRQDDHVFVEASGVEQGKVHLRVWGYGPNDSDGFRWHCEYRLGDGAITCADENSSH